MATSFQRAASFQKLLPSSEALQQPLATGGMTATSNSFQTCRGCKRLITTSVVGELFSTSFGKLKRQLGASRPEGLKVGWREHRRRDIKIRALQNEGEALEKVRSQLEKQLSVSNAVEDQELKSVPATVFMREDPKFDKWPQLLLTLFAIGTVAGPLLDGIHSVTGLQVYDTGAIEIGTGKLALKTDIWVFPLLGVFYAVVGGLYPFLDELLTPKAPEPDLNEEEGPGILAATWGPTAEPGKEELPAWSEVPPPWQFLFLGFLLSGSAYLYRNDIGNEVIWFVLLGSCVGSWTALDGTWWGLAVAAACAVVAPAAELVLNSLFHLWHYPRADLNIAGEGVVSWVALCYFFYCPPLGNLGRFLKARFQGQPPVRK